MCLSCCGGGGEVVGGVSSWLFWNKSQCACAQPQQRLARKEENRKNVFFTSWSENSNGKQLRPLQEKKTKQLTWPIKILYFTWFSKTNKQKNPLKQLKVISGSQQRFSAEVLSPTYMLELLEEAFLKIQITRPPFSLWFPIDVYWGPDISIFKTVPPDGSKRNSGPQKTGFQFQVNMIGT